MSERSLLDVAKPKRGAMRSLLDVAQAASNTVAQNVAGTVDLTATALRSLGVPVPDNAIGSSRWFEQMGLTRPVQQGAAQVIGDTLGMVTPMAAAAKAPQIAAGVIQAGKNLAAPSTTPRMAERGGINLAPLKPGPHYRVDDLSQYTDDVYRQTTLADAEMFMPGSNSMTSQQDVWFANLPEYALGQRGNTGAMLRFDTKGMSGQLSLKKPAADQAYNAGVAEFIARDVRPSDLSKHLMSVTVDPRQDPVYMRRIRALAKNKGWKESIDESGKITFSP